MLELKRPLPKSSMAQGFGANANPLYAGQGLKGHTAQDYSFLFGDPIPNVAKNAYVYSLMNKDNADPMRYRAVFTLVQGDNGYTDWSEISYGHASEIFAEVGKTYQPGDTLMACGNSGDVYTGGVYVTREQKLAGSKSGAHLHGPQVRPVERVTKRRSGKQYLTTANGYLKKDGFYFEVINYGNGYNGCIDPEPFFKDPVVVPPTPPPQTMKLEFGAHGPQVTQLQTILKKLGYFPATQDVTDYYGTITLQAYNEFKMSTGLQITL